MTARWMSRLRGPVLASLMVGTGLLGAPRAAVAQQGWSGSPEDLANTFPGSTPWVAMDRAGNAMTVWNETGSLIFARRYSAAERTWDQPVQISGGLLGHILDIVMDLEGNATVLYQGSTGLFVTSYSASSRTWSQPHLVFMLLAHNCRFEFGRMAVDATGQVRFVWTYTCAISGRVSSTIYAGGTAIASVPDGAASGSDISLDTAGNAIALWAEVRHNAETLVRSADYSAGARMWGPPTTVFTGPVGAQVLGPRLDTDGSGNILAAWQFEGGDARVRAARFDRTNSTWGEVTDLSDGPAVSVPEVAVDVSGNGVAMWAEQHGDAMRLHAARYNAASAAWSRPIDVTPIGRQSGDPSVAFDGYGNLTATWWESDGAQTVIRAARLSTTDVTTSFDLARFDQLRAKPALSVSDNGAAAVLWVHDTDQTAVLQAAQWDPTPAPPSITGITPGEGILTVAFAPPLTVEPAFAPTYYEYSINNGGSWTTGGQPTNVSPLVIRNLSWGVPYAVRLRAVNLTGPGAASAAAIGTPTFAPFAPTQLTVTAQAGRVITVRWVPPTSGLPPTSYVLQGGSLPGEVQASFPTDSLMPTFTFSAPQGEYYVRVHALAGGGWSPASNEIRIFVDVPRPPSAPSQLLAAVNGAEVALSWKNTFEGGPPVGLLLKLSGSTVASLPLGEMFRVANVPPGTYDIALAAVNAWGESPLSNGVRVRVPSSCLVPDAPQSFTATATGQAFDLAWSPPSSGAAITGYTVEVSGAYNGSFNTTDRTLTGMAAPGIYTVSVRAGNSCGVGPPAFAPRTIVIQ